MQTLGVDKFTTFAGKDSVAARIGQAEFEHVLQHLLTFLTIDVTITLVSMGSFISRMCPLRHPNPTFREHVFRWLQNSSNPNDIARLVWRAYRQGGTGAIEHLFA